MKTFFYAQHPCIRFRIDGFHSSISRVIIIAMMFGAGLCAPLNAQSICGVPAQTYPCVDQPKENQDTVTGLLVAAGGAPPSAADVHLKITGFEQIDGPDITAGTTKFTFHLPGKLGPTGTVTVSVTGAGTTGAVPIQIAPAAGKLCKATVAAADAPCVTQPVEGDVQVKGNVAADSDNPPAGTVVNIKINGTLIAGKSAQIDGSKFTFSGLDALSQYDTVEVVRSQPAPAAGQQVPSTGIVKVIANKSSTNLKLTIANASLTFGHQAMGLAGTAQKVTITNASANDVDIFDPADTMTSSNYAITSDTCTTTLVKKTGTCSFEIAYSPLSISSRPGCTETDYIVVVPATPAARQAFDTALAAFKDSYDVNTATNCRAYPNESAKQKANVAQPGPRGVVANAAVEDENRKLSKSSNDEISPFQPTFQVIALSGTPIHWQYPLTRAVVGVDLSAPSAQAVKQAYFVDFDLLAPLKLPGMKTNEDPLEDWLWLWFNPRITSLPQAANYTALSTINETGSFLSSETSKGTLSDIQGLDVSGGFELAIVKPRDGIPWWAGYENTQARLAPSLIVGGGMSTPFSTDNTDVISGVNTGICSAYAAPSTNTTSSSAGLVCQTTAPVPPSTSASTVIIAPDGSSKQYVDFYTPQRSRFFRKAYGGVRLKTYFFSRTIKGNCDPKPKRGESGGDCDGLYDIFPGIIDLTFGKDEAVTAGHMSTWLFRLDAVYPLPFKPSIHLFASAYTALEGNRATQPFNSYVINTPMTGANNDFNTFRYAIAPLNRDYFRIGIGVDLVQLFKKPSDGGQPSSPSASKATAGSSPKS